MFFFFQAEDGIRDHCVTGVQTCALPILPRVLIFLLMGFISSSHQRRASRFLPRVLIFLLMGFISSSHQRRASRFLPRVLIFLLMGFISSSHQRRASRFLPRVLIFVLMGVIRSLAFRDPGGGSRALQARSSAGRPVRGQIPGPRRFSGSDCLAAAPRRRIRLPFLPRAMPPRLSSSAPSSSFSIGPVPASSRTAADPRSSL